MGDGGGAKVGKNVRVEAVVNLGRLAAEDVTWSCTTARWTRTASSTTARPCRWSRSARTARATLRYGVDMPCARSGMTGYTVRVLPHHSSWSIPTRWP